MELFYLNMQSRQIANAGYPTREEIMEFAANSWKLCTNCKHEHKGALSLSPCPECDCKDNKNMNRMESMNPKAWKLFGGARGAILMTSEYYDRIGGIDCTNVRIVASEAGFGLRGEMVLYEDEDIVVHWVGKPDLVVFDKGSRFLAPLDHKTVDRVRSDINRKFKPHMQTCGYIWAIGQLAKGFGYDVPVDRCIINVAARLPPAEKPRDGKKKPRFTRIYPTYSPTEIEEWRLNVALKVKDLYCDLRHGLDAKHWEMRDSSCHLYGGCDYRGVCSVAPVNRQLVLQSDFIQVAPWIPYEVEEDEGDD